MPPNNAQHACHVRWSITHIWTVVSKGSLAATMAAFIVRMPHTEARLDRLTLKANLTPCPRLGMADIRMRGF